MQWMNPDVARKVFRKANVNVGPSRDGRVEMLQACARGHSIKTVWPSGLRRWLQAPVRKGVGSNPTAVILCSALWLLLLHPADTMASPLNFLQSRHWACMPSPFNIFQSRDLPCTWGSSRQYGRSASGYIAQWLERLTADQQVPGSNPGVPSSALVSSRAQLQSSS